MKLIESNLSVPVYLKTEENMVWPDDKMFYLLSKNGLFICRNHAWFQSCSPAKTGPSDLFEQKAELSLSYPVLPRALVEKAVGFFRNVYDKDHWESALIIVFNRQTQQIELLCPDQEVSWGSVHYQIPPLQPHMALIGDFHSHCNFSPTPSMTDEGDELNRPGMHLIAGYLKDEKPEFHCVVVADGTRFEVKDLSLVMEPYVSSDPRLAPPEWLAKVKEKYYHSTYSGGSSYGYGYSGMGGYSGLSGNDDPTQDDKRIINKILSKFLDRESCPTMTEVRTALFRDTRGATYPYCEHRAKKFVKSWEKAKRGKERHEQAVP